MHMAAQKNTSPLSTPEVADLLFMDRSSVTRAAARGEIPGAEKLNGGRGAWVFDRQQIEDYARKRLAEHEERIERTRARLGAAS